METLRGLDSVRVDKDFLLKRVQVNRENHKKIYDEAMKAWHKQIMKKMNDELKKVEKNKSYQPSVFIAQPDSHLRDYDKVIDLLKASLDKEFALSSTEFSQYVRDEWAWKEMFTTTVSGCYGG